MHLQSPELDARLELARAREQQLRWQLSQQTFDARLLEIADDTERSLWMNRATGAIFAPYDGGFDLFPCSHADAAALRTEHADWLSDYPGGL